MRRRSRAPASSETPPEQSTRAGRLQAGDTSRPAKPAGGRQRTDSTFPWSAAGESETSCPPPCLFWGYECVARTTLSLERERPVKVGRLETVRGPHQPPRRQG